jgi:predicted  nucleic acid-binding Zn-ribbon protein
LDSLNKIQELQNKVRQLQTIIDSDDKDGEASGMVNFKKFKNQLTKISTELEEEKEKSTRLEKEIGPLKKEIERLKDASKTTSDKSFDSQVKYQREIAELEKKVEAQEDEIEKVLVQNF